ncbi:MAG: hypothetical protein QG597_564 [Actinomycetota bacterium]|nr:hypothetical protein [Actinomycetota bacterium]
MTGTHTPTEHVWNTQLWLDDLHADAASAFQPPQDAVAEPDPVLQNTTANHATVEEEVDTQFDTTPPHEPNPQPVEPNPQPADQTDPDHHPPGVEHPPASARFHFGPTRSDDPEDSPVYLDEPPPTTALGEPRDGSAVVSATPTAIHDAADHDATDTDPRWMIFTGPTLNDSVPEPFTRAPEPAPPAPRFNKALALGFGAATLVGTVAMTATLLAMRSHPAPDAAMDEDSSTQISVVAAPPAPTTEAVGTDTAIPYVASADCPPGSTPAQSAAGEDPTRAWVCVRDGVDGQVLTLDLGRTMLVTAVSLTPGWVGTDPTGTDQWPAHRVVTKVQWIFDADPSTVITQNTGNIRGEAVQPVPGRGVLASTVTMIVLQTSRPPADVTPPPSGAPGSTGGLFEEPLPPAGKPTAGATESFSLPGLPRSTISDPVDSTFAVSAVKVLGHPPT